MGAVGAAQAIPHGEAVARQKATGEGVPERLSVVRMDGYYHRLKPAHARPVHIRDVQPEEIDHALVEENRLAVRSQPPDMARDHVHQL